MVVFSKYFGAQTVVVDRLPIGYIVTVYERRSVIYSFQINFDRKDREPTLDLDDRTRDMVEEGLAKAKEDYAKRKQK